MSLTIKMEEALNEQLAAEFSSAYLYLSMSGYFETANLPGMSHWMYQQFQEEQNHKMKFFRYIYDRGGKVILKSIDAPKSEWNSALNVFEESLEHEQGVSKRINNLVDLALSEKDHATFQFLQWYVNEQVEEEATLSKIIDDLRKVQNSPSALFFVDKELGNRANVPDTGAN